MHRLIFIELRVSGYNRLALSDTKAYTITPRNIHLILGTNGSGKSSLLELMTPLPPNRKDFDVNGFKEIIFKYDNNIYKIYSEDGKHTIWKDNEIVLENAGMKMILEYCELVFKITPALHRFMLGTSKLTSMSLQERKEFITNIAHVDYTYANKVYADLKRKLKDENAVLKHLNSKALSLKEYIINEEDASILNNRKIEITQVLYELYKLMETTEKPVINLQDTTYLRLLYKTKDLLDKAGVGNLFNGYNDMKKQLIISKSDREKLCKDRDELSNRIYSMSKLLSSNELEATLTTINNELQELTKDRLFIVTDEQYDYIKSVWSKYTTDIASTLSNLIEDLFTIKNKTIDDIITEHESYQSELTKIISKITELETKIISINTKEKDYMSITKGICCTTCGTPIVNDKLIELLDNDRKLKNKYQDEIDILKNDKNTLLENNTAVEYYKIYHTVTQSIKELQLSKYLTIDNTLLDLYNSLVILERDVRVYPKVKECLKEKSNLLEMSRDVLDENMYMLLEKEYELLCSKIDDIKRYEDTLESNIKLVDTISSNIVEIESIISMAEKDRKNNIKKHRNDSLTIMINELKSELTEVNIKLDKYNYSIRESTQLQLDIQKSVKDIELLEMMIEELSPSTGLIADSIKSFLVKYIDEVNEIINRVWSYKLEVLPYDPIELEKGITYRFPVRTAGEDNSDDINNTSESMREIISLAFRLVSLKYLNMGLYPLMIDEFGRSMDEIHLIKSYDMLEEIVEESDVQMFIIAHIKTAYIRFSNAGISIISDLNLEGLK